MYQEELKKKKTLTWRQLVLQIREGSANPLGPGMFGAPDAVRKLAKDCLCVSVGRTIGYAWGGPGAGGVGLDKRWEGAGMGCDGGDGEDANVGVGKGGVS